MTKQVFDIDRMILGLNFRVKDLLLIRDQNMRQILLRQIESLPNTREEKQYLLEEFQLQCDMFDHGYNNPWQTINPNGMFKTI